jgi:hypothetical protein
MADLLNRETQTSADINILKQQGVSFAISLASTNSSLTEVNTNLIAQGTTFSISLVSTNSKFTEVDNSLLSTAGFLLQTSQRVTFLSDIVDTSFTATNLLINDLQTSLNNSLSFTSTNVTILNEKTLTLNKDLQLLDQGNFSVKTLKAYNDFFELRDCAVLAEKGFFR